MGVHELHIEGATWWCTGSGTSCYGSSETLPDEPFILEPRKKMPDDVYDDTLRQLTAEMNNLLKKASQKRNDKNLRFVTTSRGLVLIWTSKEVPPEKEFKKYSEDEKSELFGLDK
ncbi:MAG TPA: hypothetical protein VD815_00055 [Candidatus Saccharimonadales bacterium]|nr:hypothetical protein [Candidatus Saccharimonadales bacterium]